MPSIYDTYFRDPLYFQRMLEFFLHARFRAVRIYIAEKRKEECMFFGMDGSLVDVSNNRRRFKTLTDWYNAAFKTKHDIYYTGVFSQIRITQQVNLNEILQTVKRSEVAEFQDMKYRSNIAYNYIFRRLRALFINCDWQKKQDYLIFWKGHTYSVANNHTYAMDGGNINVFLKQFIGSNVGPMEICMSDGSRRSLTEPILQEPVQELVQEPVPAESELVPEEPKDVETPRISILEEYMRNEMENWNMAHQAETQQLHLEVDGMKKQILDMSMQLQNLSVQHNNLLSLVGKMLQPQPPMYVPQSPTVYTPPYMFPQNLNTLYT